MSLEREIRKIMASSVQENFVKSPDCDICGDGSPCTCGESQEVNEDIRTLPKDKQRALQHADKTAKPKSKVSLAPTPGIKTEATLKVKDFTGKAPKIQGVTVKKGPSSPFGGHMVTMTGPEDKLIAYAKKHLDGKGNTLKDIQKSINEDVNLDEAFENFFAEGYEGEVKKVLDKKGIDAYFKNGKLMVSKRDKPMVMQILKRQDFDMPTIQVEEIRMENNRFGLSDSLVDAVANVLAGKQPIEEYDAKKDHNMDPTSHVMRNKETGMFCVYDINNKKVAEFKTKDEADAYAKKNHDDLMKKEDKKHKKMDAVGKEDGDIDNDGDEDESDEYLAKRRKAIGKAMKKDGGGKEPVDTKPKMDEEKIDEKLTQRQRDMRDFGRGKDKHATANVKRRADDNKGLTVGDLKRRQHKGEPGFAGDGDHDTSSRPKDKLATQPDAKTRLANKKSSDRFKARQSASQSGSGRNNMGGVGIREEKIDERLKLGDPKRDSREIARTGKRVNPSNVGNFNTKTQTTTSSGTGKPFHRKYTTVKQDDSGDTKLQKSGATDKIGGGQSRAQRAGKKDRMNKGEPEKDRFQMGEPSRGGDNPNAKPKVNMKAKPKGKLPEDMTDAQMKRREEIVKELKKKSADFESRYGDKADAVMYATATKMAMKGK